MHSNIISKLKEHSHIFLLRIREVAEEFAVIDGGEDFGGGNLQQYFGIRSNTSAAGFLKVIQFPKQSKPTRRDSDLSYTAPPEQDKVMPSFSIVANSDIASFLRSTGKMITSLQVVGLFLSHVGFSMMLELFNKHGGRQVFYPRHWAKRIDVCMTAGGGVEYHTTVERENNG